MPEIKPDLSDESRCISVHWNLPVQCVLPRGHRENWHEAWHPQTGNRLRYQRSMGGYVTEDLHHGEWHDLEIPPPDGFCNDQHSSYPNVRCTGQYGHGWNHRAVVDGCTYSWNTPIPKGLTVDQLTRDVTRLRGMLVDAHARIERLQDDNVRLLGQQAKDDGEYAQAMLERDRYRTAYHSARERAEGRGEGILRVVKDREAYQGWLKQEQNVTAQLRAQAASIRTAALAEAKDEVVEWLVKKAHEGTEVSRLADKVERGAIRLFFDAELAAAASVPKHYDKVPDPLDGCHWCACGNRWPCKDAAEVAA